MLGVGQDIRSCNDVDYTLIIDADDEFLIDDPEEFIAVLCELNHQ